MKATPDVLRDREAGGLTLFIGLQIAGLVLLGLGIILFVERSEPLNIIVVGIPVLGALSALLVMVRRRYHMALAGHLAILVSFLATGPILSSNGRMPVLTCIPPPISPRPAIRWASFWSR